MPHSPGLCRAEAQPKGNHVCIHSCIHRLNYISSSLWDLRGLELEKKNLCFSKTVCVCLLLYLGTPSGSRDGAAQGREGSFWPRFEGKLYEGTVWQQDPKAAGYVVSAVRMQREDSSSASSGSQPPKSVTR